MWQAWIPAASAVLLLAQMVAWHRVMSAHGLVWSRLWWTPLMAVAIGCLSVMAAMFGPLGSVVAGLAPNAFVGARVYWSVRRSARLGALLERAARSDVKQSAAALTELDAEVEKLLRNDADYEVSARWVLTLASKVALAGHRERALAWTLRLVPGRLGRATRVMLAQAEATLRIGTDREGARRAIARAPRPAMAPYEEALVALETLLEALEGDATSAAERSSLALERASRGPSRVAWLMVRAHALARLGTTEEARRVLLTLRAEGGDMLLERVVAHAGPASQLAESVLGERGPYR